MKTLRASLVLAFVLLSGCQYRSYSEGQTKYTSLSIGTNQTVAPFSLKAGKEGDASFRELSSKGITNDSTSIVESAVGAAVKASLGK